MIKGVVFDMDGVLVDNMAMHTLVFKEFCAQYGVTEWEEKLRRCAGMGNDEIMVELMPKSLIDAVGLTELGDLKEAMYREMYAPTITPIEGLKEILEEFKSRGIKCAVGSSGCRENVEFVIKSCGIDNYFDVLVYSNMVTRCKPDPEIYSTAIQLLDIKPNEALIFEDALAGITAARAAHAGEIIGLATTHSEEELRSISGLETIIKDYREVLGKL